jgi:hypothetical protein
MSPLSVLGIWCMMLIATMLYSDPIIRLKAVRTNPAIHALHSLGLISLILGWALLLLPIFAVVLFLRGR